MLRVHHTANQQQIDGGLWVSMMMARVLITMAKMMNPLRGLPRASQHAGIFQMRGIVLTFTVAV